MDFISMLPSIFKGVTGIGQLFAGIFGKGNRPTKTIQNEDTQALNVAKGLASQTKLPGQGILETQLGEKTANLTKSIERMGAGGAGLGALSNIYAQEAGAKRNLAADAAKYYTGNQGILMGALNRMGAKKDAVWDYNQKQKYEEQAAASSALMQAGLQNTSTGLSDIVGANSYANLFKNMGLGNGSFGMGNGNMGTTNNGVTNNNSAWLQNYLLQLQQGNNNPYYNIKY